MTGMLIWNGDRPDVAFDSGALYGGLHCGNCFRCFVDGAWTYVTLEYGEEWYLICDGHTMPVCYGARVEL